MILSIFLLDWQQESIMIIINNDCSLIIAVLDLHIVCCMHEAMHRYIESNSYSPFLATPVLFTRKRHVLSGSHLGCHCQQHQCNCNNTSRSFNCHFLYLNNCSGVCSWITTLQLNDLIPQLLLLSSFYTQTNSSHVSAWLRTTSLCNFTMTPH